MSWHDMNLGDAIHVKHGFAFKSQFFEEDGDHIVLTPHYTTLAVWKVLLRFGHIRLQISAALSGWCRIHFLS